MPILLIQTRRRRMTQIGRPALQQLRALRLYCGLDPMVVSGSKLETNYTHFFKKKHGCNIDKLMKEFLPSIKRTIMIERTNYLHSLIYNCNMAL